MFGIELWFIWAHKHTQQIVTNACRFIDSLFSYSLLKFNKIIPFTKASTKTETVSY